MARKRRRRTVRVRKDHEDRVEQAVDNAEVEEVEEEVVKRPPRRRRRRKVEKPVSVEEKVAEVEVADSSEEKTTEVDVVEESAERTFAGLLAALSEGDALIIRCTAEDTYVISKATHESIASAPEPKPAGKKVSVNDMLTDEFKEWRTAWAELTYEEKVEKAEEAGVEWNRHENPKVDVMRLSAAMREALGIEKWRPEYSTRAARAAARGK